MSHQALRPAQLCQGLLDALDASDGRRRRRKRDTVPDAIGLGIKRDLLARAVLDDPSPEDFEGWLLGQCLAAPETVSTGSMRSMALEVLADWRLAQARPDFEAWLREGAFSADAARD